MVFLDRREMELSTKISLEKNSILCVKPSNTLILIEELISYPENNEVVNIKYRYLNPENEMVSDTLPFMMFEVAHNSNEIFQVIFDDMAEEAKTRLEF